MTRLAGSILAESQSQVVRPIWTLYMNILNNPLYLNSSDVDYTIGANTYTHEVFTLDALEERNDITAPMMHATLALDKSNSAVAALLATRANYVWRSLIISLYLANNSTHVLLGTPTPLLTWTGLMSSVATIQDNNQGHITTTAQSWVSILKRPPGPKFTQYDQQRRSPEDSIFSNVARLDGREIIWMGNAISNGNGNGGSGSGSGSGSGNDAGNKLWWQLISGK